MSNTRVATCVRPSTRQISRAIHQLVNRACPTPLHVAIRRSSTDTRKWSTPLAKSLAEAIATTGPVSIAKFMRQCLTSPEGGYYTRLNVQGQDQFGKSGDFITSPEISQIFGELLGIWFVAEWMAQGRKSSGVQFIELGPGRGTLMADMLRTVSNFKDLRSAIDAIYLVEASPVLRQIQKNLLCGENASFEKHPKGQQCTSRHLPGVQIVWLEDVTLLPQDISTSSTPFIVAHEFFDALPIHAFQSVKPQGSHQSIQTGRAGTITTSVTGATSSTSSSTSNNAQEQQQHGNRWHELVVSPAAPPSIINPPKAAAPEFELSVSAFPAPHSQLLPSLSRRYGALLGSEHATIEISPESLTTVQQLARMIGHSSAAPPDSKSKGKSSSTRGSSIGEAQSQVQTRRQVADAAMGAAGAAGAALIIDYGPAETVPVSSLRGIRSHRRCSPFEAPGEVDISADVDFGALAEMALRASEHVEVHGPAEQGDWLQAMGGRERCKALVRRANASSSSSSHGNASHGNSAAAAAAAAAVEKDDDRNIAKRVETGWKRLIEKGPNGMGRLYKVMAIIPLSGGTRRPVGFGGDVSA